MADTRDSQTAAEKEKAKYQAELNEYGMPGRMYLLAPDDMTHESYAHYQKISGAKDVNVYVDTQDKSQDPHVKYLPDSNGNAVVIINDAEHQYSEKYARNTLYSDHQIQKLIENKKLVPVTRDNLNSAMSLETFDKYQALAKKMLPEGSKIPDLYLDYTQYADDYAQAATVLSKEGIEAAIYKFNEQGKRINLADFEHKTTGPEVLHQNAIDNVNGAMINGKPESFYTLQGAMHSENPAGNLAVFTQNGFHTIDIAIAPAEVSHLGLTQQKDIVTPSYLYSLNADKGFSGQTAQDNYIDIRQTPQWPKTRSQCIAELPIEFQKAMPPEVDIFKLVPSSTPSLDLDTIDTTPKKTR